MSKRYEQQIEQVAQAVTGLLTDAVQETIEQRSPEPARQCIARLLHLDREAAPDDESGPAELMATLGLVRWAGLARRDVGERPGWIEEVLAWIEESLGRRYRARARYTSGALRSDEDASEIMIYSDALQDDFLPSLIWLIAGVVARYGEGDVGWLRDLDRTTLTGP